MLTTRLTITCRWLLAAALLVSLTGCFNPTPSRSTSAWFEQTDEVHEWASAPTSEFYTTTATADQQWESYRRTMNLNQRQLRDDLINFWRFDAPIRGNISRVR
ncbi:MAG: hypothetical protein JJU36_00200 [Phycisphaeraceae bacterium]|nr:hypothetical protein [Phycisphaeraceae bacterium]